MSDKLNPITREEMYLAAAAGQEVNVPEPITRKEMFLAKLVNNDAATPAAVTRSEMFIAMAAENGAGGGGGEPGNNAVVQPLEITENGTYTAPAGVDGYNPVSVNVGFDTEDVDFALDAINGEVINGVVVTFIGADGSVLCELSVLPGKNCPDPYREGHINRPRKPSTVSTEYEYYGWSFTDGGEADSNALVNVTEDRTLYAAFMAYTRYYTVQFWDGNNLVHTEQVAYDKNSTYVYDKVGYNFIGWEPKPVNVASNMNCYGTWEASSFAADSWKQIANNCINGVAAQHYNVGDERQIYVQYDKAYDGASGAYITLRIINIGAEKNYNQETMNGMVVLCATPLHMSKVAYQADFVGEHLDILRYYGSDIFYHLEYDVDDILPDDLRTVIRSTSRYCSSMFVGSSQTSGSYAGLKIWPLTVTEVGGTMNNVGYEYFKQTNVLSGATEKRILRLQGEAVEWLLREPYSGSRVSVVRKDGSIGQVEPTYADAYAVFAFFIGG